MVDFEAAKDKVMMGAERRSMVMTEEEKRLTAYHEAGHAIVGLSARRHRPDPQGDDHPPRPGARPGHAACPRATALGSREKLKADIAVAMGGRVAEELIFGQDKVTAGAASDIEQATKIAREMVTQWGMSDKLGPVGYAENTAGGLPRPLDHADQEHLRGDRAADRPGDPAGIVENGYVRAREVLTEKLELLHTLAHGSARARDAEWRGDRRDHAWRAAPGCEKARRRHPRCDGRIRQAGLCADDTAIRRQRAARGRDRTDPAAGNLSGGGGASAEPAGVVCHLGSSGTA